MQEDIDCIFFAHLTLGGPICLLGRTWPCETDSSLCGDTCPDYRKETVTQ